MWVKKLFPHTVARFSTSYNRDIRVNYESGKYKLLVNGSKQSGDYVRGLWNHAFTHFDIYYRVKIRNILVLGVAGGDVIQLIHTLFPNANITGVDIDKTMINIGKKYFGLKNIPNIRFVVADAKQFVKKKKKYDLIISDTYIGASIPSFVGEITYLEDLKKIISPKGMLVINYLREFEYKNLSDALNQKLKLIFPTVRDTSILNNRFFLCVC